MTPPGVLQSSNPLRRWLRTSSTPAGVSSSPLATVQSRTLIGRQSRACTIRRVSDPTPEHPNLPRRGALALMFVGIVLAGLLGGLIGYGVIRASCADTPTHA